MNVYRSLGTGMLGWDWPRLRLGFDHDICGAALVLGKGERHCSFIDMFNGEHAIDPSLACANKGYKRVRPRSAYAEPS